MGRCSVGDQEAVGWVMGPPQPPHPPNAKTPMGPLYSFT